jgi:hypothetical protein
VRELRVDPALEVVEEADAEDVVADIRDVRVRRRRGDHRHVRLLRDRAAGERQRRCNLAEHGDRMMIVDEAGDRGGRLALLARVVDRDELDLLALHAALRVALLDREPDRLIGRDAERRLRTGHRREVADDDRAARRTAAAAAAAAAILLALAARDSEHEGRVHRDDPQTSPSVQIHGDLP